MILIEIDDLFNWRQYSEGWLLNISFPDFNQTLLHVQGNQYLNSTTFDMTCSRFLRKRRYRQTVKQYKYAKKNYLQLVECSQHNYQRLRNKWPDTIASLEMLAVNVRTVVAIVLVLVRSVILMTRLTPHQANRMWMVHCSYLINQNS